MPAPIPSHPCRSCGVPVYAGDDWTYCSGGFQFCYNNSPNPSKSLRDARNAGLRIVCNVAPYVGERVVYDPGYSSTHPRPWVLPGTGLRFSGRDCLAMPVPPAFEPPRSVSRGFLAQVFRRHN